MRAGKHSPRSGKNRLGPSHTNLIFQPGFCFRWQTFNFLSTLMHYIKCYARLGAWPLWLTGGCRYRCNRASFNPPQLFVFVYFWTTSMFYAVCGFLLQLLEACRACWAWSKQLWKSCTQMCIKKKDNLSARTCPLALANRCRPQPLPSASPDPRVNPKNNHFPKTVVTCRHRSQSLSLTYTHQSCLHYIYIYIYMSLPLHTGLHNWYRGCSHLCEREAKERECVYVHCNVINQQRVLIT